MKRTYDCKVRFVGNSYVVTVPMPYVKKRKIKKGEVIEVKFI